MQIPALNLDAIADPATHALVVQLLNLIEALAAENAVLRAENQQLRAENARLKGGSGKPDTTPPTPPCDHSSEAERQVRTPRGQPKKNATLTVTREEVLRRRPGRAATRRCPPRHDCSHRPAPVHGGRGHPLRARGLVRPRHADDDHRLTAPPATTAASARPFGRWC